MNVKLKLIGLVLVMVMSLTGASVALAARPIAVRIDAPTVIGTSPNTFTASGPAVAAGRICPIGKVHDLSNVQVGPDRGRIRTLEVVKRFECSDASGTFDVKMIVRLNLRTHRTTARWEVIGGTGDYTTLLGRGKLVGVPIVPGVSIDDKYRGRVQ